jgi:hypothetical protein
VPGIAVERLQAQRKVDDLAVPGDPGSATTTYTGEITSAALS